MKKEVMFAAFLTMASPTGVVAHDAMGGLCPTYTSVSSTGICKQHENYPNYFGNNITEGQIYPNTMCGRGLSSQKIPEDFLSNMAIAKNELSIIYTTEAKIYLDARPEVRGQILAIGGKLGDYFPYGEILVDVDEISGNVIINVVGNRSVDDMLKDLDRFDYAWWLEAQDNFSNNIIVDVMPV